MSGNEAHQTSSNDTHEPHIRRLDFDAQRGTVRSNASRGGRSLLDDDVDFMDEVAGGILDRDRQRMRREVTRTSSLICAVLSCLCAGSITAYSFYAPRFQTHLHYTQLQVNAISIGAELGLYLLVPLFGYLCDRYSPAPLSLLSSLLFGIGYFLAAFTYRAGPEHSVEAIQKASGLPFSVMMVAFILIGAGTVCMYLSGVATCAKNFSNSKYRGFILALPIAAFGLSGMWQSQVGALVFYERLPDGAKGDVDVFKYFIFLGILLITVGLLGSLGLRIVNEEELIDRRVDELERSGLLESSDFFSAENDRRQHQGYGTINNPDHPHDDDDASSTSSTQPLALSESLLLKKAAEESQLRRKKSWLLNHATTQFLSDRTMWLLAAGFFLVTGPGESYINNVGTVIPTLTPRHWARSADPPAGSPATHVSIIAITSTIARLLTGVLADIFARKTPPSSPSLTSSNPSPSQSQSRYLSRLTLLLPSAVLQSLAFLLLALPFLVPSSPTYLPLSSALLGLGYGASFSLVPIIISVVWDVENFATNWGIVAVVPAPGAALWGVVYSFGYAAATGAGDGNGEGGEGDKGRCFGAACFQGWAWGCAASVGLAVVLWAFAWRSWRRRDVVV